MNQIQIDEWHATNVNKYQQCAKAACHDLRTEGPLPPPTWEMFRGTAFHYVLEHFMQMEGHRRTPERLSMVINMEPWLDDPDYHYFEHRRHDLVGDCHIFADRYLQIENPRKVMVRHTELTLSLPIGNVPYVGTVDRIDDLPSDGIEPKGTRIVDYKTGSYKDKDEWRQDARRQIVIYALAYYLTGGILADDGLIVWLGEKFRTERVSITWEKIQRAKVQLLETYVGATRGIAPASPGPLCGWCSHVHNCREGEQIVQQRYMVGMRLSDAVQDWIHNKVVYGK